MDKEFHPTFYQACDYLSMLGLKLNHVSKRGHKSFTRLKKASALSINVPL